MTESVIFEPSARFKSILIFGPPGSGKGTQGKFLSSAGNHFHLSSGDIFRGLSPESPAGKVYHKYASKGNLVPDEVTIRIWYHYVLGLIATNRYLPNDQYLLLDGIPRTVEQAKLLEQHIEIEAIIVLGATKQSTLLKRMQRRALIEKRHDDMDQNVLKKRFEVYNKATKKVLTYYKDQNIYTFEASKKPLEVLRDILDELCYILA